MVCVRSLRPAPCFYLKQNAQENITVAKKLLLCKILNTKETAAANTVHAVDDAKSISFNEVSKQ